MFLLLGCSLEAVLLRLILVGDDREESPQVFFHMACCAAMPYCAPGNQVLHRQDGESADARRRATELVSRLSGADTEPSSTAASAEELMSLVYDELHRLAAHYMGGERREHTLQPTALVNEAYLRLVDGSQVDWQGHRHFVAVSALAMRRILIDHARARPRA